VDASTHDVNQNREVPHYVYAVIPVAVLVWFAPFVRIWKKAGSPAQTDRRARWGILLQFVSISLLWQSPFWTRHPGAWTIVLAFGLLALACLISWSSARALGREFRLDAALGADHQLVTTGPYRWMRHPIYTSMLCLLLGMGLLVAPLYLLLICVALFLIGTTVRIRIEERLLAARFGESFTRYQQQASRLIPFIV
jgi:protein-S-isoprenylcysteine O-methyltransferase Ste14